MFSTSKTSPGFQPSRSAAAALAARALGLAGCDLDRPLRQLARQHLLDALAAALIGCRSSLLPHLFPSPNAAPTAAELALLWSYSVNRSVFEDGSREGACHPAAAVIPAMMALLPSADWDRLDRSLLAGYEVMVRLARAGNPDFIRRGFHPTSLAAPFGAAAAAGVMLGLDQERLTHALCLAALGASGLMKAFRAADSQPLQVAWGARAGLSAALLAQAGQQGYLFILEEGFFPAYLGREPVTPLEAPLESSSALAGSYLKPTPGCRHLQPPLDALAAATAGRRLQEAEISSIAAYTYQTALDLEIDEVKARGDAYFNIPYALAAFLVLGQADWEAFSSRYFLDQRFLNLRAKTTVEVGPEFESAYPKKRGARVQVVLRDGQLLTGRVDNPQGEPEKPLALNQTKEKFVKAAAGYLPDGQVERLLSILEETQPGPGWAELSALARGLRHLAKGAA